MKFSALTKRKIINWKGADENIFRNNRNFTQGFLGYIMLWFESSEVFIYVFFSGCGEMRFLLNLNGFDLLQK